MLNTLKKFIPAKLKRNIRTTLNKGNKYTCPLCGYNSKGWFAIGYDFPVNKEKQIIGGGKRKGGCYKCSSFDRERLIYVYLTENLQIFDSGAIESILHIAPETNLSNKLQGYGFKNYVCGDLHTEGYTYPAHVKNMNITEIPYADHTFDLVICNHVLEHVPDDIKAMNEINRVLKIGGQAILQVPISKNTDETLEDFSITDPRQREIVFGQADHIRIYGQDYTNRLQKAGFKVSSINISHGYPEYGLNNDEDIFVCIK